MQRIKFNIVEPFFIDPPKRALKNYGSIKHGVSPSLNFLKKVQNKSDFNE